MFVKYLLNVRGYSTQILLGDQFGVVEKFLHLGDKDKVKISENGVKVNDPSGSKL